MKKPPPHSSHSPIICYDLISDGTVFGSLSCPPRPEGAIVAELPGRLLVMKKRGYLRQTLVLETVAEEEVARLSLDVLGGKGSLQRVDGKKIEFRISGKLDWRSPEGGFAGRATPLRGLDVMEGEVRPDRPDQAISPYQLSLWGLLQLDKYPREAFPAEGDSPRFSSVSSRVRDVSSASPWEAAEPLLP